MKQFIIKHKIWLILVALLIFVILAVRSMYWLGCLGFIGFMLVLAVAVGLLVYYILSLKRDWYLKIIFILAIICVLAFPIALLTTQAPNLTSNEVKIILNYRLPSDTTRVMSAEYMGDGIWKVRTLNIYGIRYWYYNERNNRHGITSEQTSSEYQPEPPTEEEARRLFGLD